MAVAYAIRAIFANFPLEWLWAIPISLVTGVVLWTSIPYLLLDRQVHWRRLLVVGGTSGATMTVFAIATPIYMPQIMTRATNEFGLFGITITIIGYLLAASFVLVSCAAIGAEFDASDAALADGPEGAVQADGPRAGAPRRGTCDRTPRTHQR